MQEHERWLYENEEALELVRRGLEDARQGRLVEVDLKDLEDDAV